MRGLKYKVGYDISALKQLTIKVKEENTRLRGNKACRREKLVLPSKVIEGF